MTKTGHGRKSKKHHPDEMVTRFSSQNVSTNATLKVNSATGLLAPDQVVNIDVACRILGNNVRLENTRSCENTDLSHLKKGSWIDN